MRKERSAGNLTIELRGPASGDLIGAFRATAFRRQAIVLDEVAVAADQRFVTLGTMCVFAAVDHSREIPRIDETEAGFASNLCSPMEVFGRCVPLIAHLVIGMEGGHVP